MVLDTLYLVVPLLKRHLSLPHSGITTKGVYSGGTQPQPGCDHAEEVADICVSLWRTDRPLHWLNSSPSPPPFRATPSQAMLVSLPPQEPMSWPRTTHAWFCPLPPRYLKPDDLHCLPQLVTIKFLDIPGKCHPEPII